MRQHKEWCDLKRPEYTGECTCTPSILNPAWKYTKAAGTNIRKNFKRIKREQKK